MSDRGVALFNLKALFFPMKPIQYFGIFLAASAFHAQTSAQVPANNAVLPAATPYVPISMDVSSTIWQRTTYEQAPDGNIVSRGHRYTELSTGLNHLVNGQWQASSESILISPDGGAASATNCAHQIYFPGDIYNGVIKLVEADGQVLISQPTALRFRMAATVC